MREILFDRDSVRWYCNRDRFVYTAKSGRISEISSDRNEVAFIGISHGITKSNSYKTHNSE